MRFPWMLIIATNISAVNNKMIKVPNDNIWELMGKKISCEQY